MSPIIIIGSGLAGYSLAREFRKLDTTTPMALVTANDGRYYSKPQLSSALRHGKTAASLGLFTAEQMAKQLNAAIYITKEVTSIQPKNHQICLGEQEVLTYDKLVLACGAKPIQPPLTGTGVAKVCTVNNLEDYQFFRQLIATKKHITILGAGLVGCEFANDLIHAGYQVTVVAPQSSPLARLLPTAAGQALQLSLAEQGVQWLLEQRAVEVVEQGEHLLIRFASGQQLLSDAVLSATGLQADIQLAQRAGLDVNQGIVVDNYLQTSQPDIYALGDCAQVMGYNLHYINPLSLCAKALAQTLAGNATPVQYPPMPIFVKTPACPITLVIPPAGSSGNWQIQGEGKDIKALFIDQAGQLQGFALTGKMVSEQASLLTALPAMLPMNQ